MFYKSSNPKCNYSLQNRLEVTCRSLVYAAVSLS